MELRSKLQKFIKVSNELIVGKPRQMQLATTCLLADGHLLLEDIPGVGKTTLVKVFAHLLGLDWKRLQFTNDILPSDILGTVVFNKQHNKFSFHEGPIFTQLLIADELNRATPKTQSACLQAMAERSVSIDGKQHSLPSPFFVVATQNPRDNYGTFPLPESQVDRFLMRISLGFPNKDSETKILEGHNPIALLKDQKTILNGEELLAAQAAINAVHCKQEVINYLLEIVHYTREHHKGLSTRASQGFLKAAKAWAWLQNRDFVIPEDIKEVGHSIMNHRLLSEDPPDGERMKDFLDEIYSGIDVVAS